MHYLIRVGRCPLDSLGYGSRREALALKHSRWNLQELRFVCSADTGLEWLLTSSWLLFLLLPPYVKGISGEVFSDCPGLRPCLGVASGKDSLKLETHPAILTEPETWIQIGPSWAVFTS
jgi:hypothetical protein